MCQEKRGVCLCVKQLLWHMLWLYRKGHAGADPQSYCLSVTSVHLDAPRGGSTPWHWSCKASGCILLYKLQKPCQLTDGGCLLGYRYWFLSALGWGAHSTPVLSLWCTVILRHWLMILASSLVWYNARWQLESLKVPLSLKYCFSIINLAKNHIC